MATTDPSSDHSTSSEADRPLEGFGLWQASPLWHLYLCLAVLLIVLAIIIVTICCCCQKTEDEEENNMTVYHWSHGTGLIITPQKSLKSYRLFERRHHMHHHNVLHTDWDALHHTQNM